MNTGTAQNFRERVLLLRGRWADDVELPEAAPAEMCAGSGDALVCSLEEDPLAIGIGRFRNVLLEIQELRADLDVAPRAFHGSRFRRLPAA